MSSYDPPPHLGVRVDLGGQKWYQLKTRPHISVLHRLVTMHNVADRETYSGRQCYRIGGLIILWLMFSNIRFTSVNIRNFPSLMSHFLWSQFHVVKLVFKKVFMPKILNISLTYYVETKNEFRSSDLNFFLQIVSLFFLPTNIVGARQFPSQPLLLATGQLSVCGEIMIIF